jgi:hypothetical protein
MPDGVDAGFDPPQLSLVMAEKELCRSIPKDDFGLIHPTATTRLRSGSMKLGTKVGVIGIYKPPIRQQDID